MAALMRICCRSLCRAPEHEAWMLILLPPALMALLLLLLWQAVAGASGLTESPGAGGGVAGCIAGARAALGWLGTQAAAWPALSGALVGGVGGALAYLVLRGLRMLGLLGCVACGIVTYALVRAAGAQLGLALPDGLSLATLGIAFTGCVLAVLGARAAHGL